MQRIQRATKHSVLIGVGYIMKRFLIVCAVFCFILFSHDVALSQQCCVGSTGNIDGSPGDSTDVSDLTSLIDFLFISYAEPACLAEANVDGSIDGVIDVSDLSALIDFLFISYAPLIPCEDETLMDPAVRMAAIDSVDSFSSTLNWSNLDAANNQLADYINTLPEFDTAGVIGETGNVWALFADSVMLMFGKNRPPSDSASAVGPTVYESIDELNQIVIPDNSKPVGNVTPQPSAAASEELPESAQVRMIQTLGAYFTPAGPTIRSWLTLNGYFMAASTSGTVNALKSVSGDGILYFDGHGGAGYYDPTLTVGEFALWTMTEVTVANIPSYTADMKAKRLVLMIEVVGVTVAGAEIRELHYGITSKFISYYWGNFAPNAMVFIDACGAGGSLAAGLRNAMLNKNASVYFGWSHIVGSDAAALVAKFMFDRLLGANEAAPKETPDQRPFPYPDIYGDLANRGLHIHPSLSAGGLTTFKSFHGSGNFGLLAPSISFMSMEEAVDGLTINGIFGTDPGAADRRVQADGVDLNVVSWTPTEIKCDIGRDGTGSAGPVAVEVRGSFGDLTPLTYRKSNVVNLTSWRIPFHYEHQEGGAKVVVEMNVHIRADIHAHREVIHEPPVNLVGVPFYHALDSYGSFTAGGSGTGCTGGCCWTSTWSGGGEIPIIENAVDAISFGALGGIDPLHHTFTMSMGAGIDVGINTNDCGSCSNDCYNSTLSWRTEIAINEGFDPEPYFTMYLNSNYDLIPGERVPSGIIPVTNYIFYDDGVATIKLTWPAVVAEFPPDPDGAVRSPEMLNAPVNITPEPPTGAK